MELKTSSKQISVTNIEVEEVIKENNTDIVKLVSETTKICILFAEPINKGILFEKNHILKAFKNYDINLTVEIFSVNKLNSIEDFDYLFIFTEMYNNKILIEDDYMTSKFISLTKLEEELYQENLKGVYLFSSSSGYDTSEVLTNSYVINRYDEKDFNSLIFGLFRKNNVLFDESTTVLNQANLEIPQIPRGKCIVVQRQTPCPQELIQRI